MLTIHSIPSGLINSNALEAYQKDHDKLLATVVESIQLATDCAHDLIKAWQIGLISESECETKVKEVANLVGVTSWLLLNIIELRYSEVVPNKEKEKGFILELLKHRE